MIKLKRGYETERSI